jgi:hypothetical protein
MIRRTSNGQAPSAPSLSIATKVMIKQSWHNMILGNKTAPIISQAGVDLDLDLLFEDCLVPL